MDFLGRLPRGKHDRPLLLTQGDELTVSCDEVDTALSMLDRDFSGCLTFSFSKMIDESIPGRITLDGQTVRCFHRFINFAGGMPLVGAYVLPYLDEYDRVYTLHVEGFTDTDGNEMLPRDIPIRTLPKPAPESQYAQREALALQAAEEGIVLMRNENGVLPLKPGTLNIFGHGFHTFRDCGAGAGRINSRYTVNLKQAVRQSDLFTLNEELAAFFKAGDALPGSKLLERAKELSSTALVVLSRFGGENTDASTAKGEYLLSDAEEELLRVVTEQFENTIVILNTPGPIDVGFVERYGVDALVWCGFGGMRCGEALLNVLSGKTNPSGKLTDTWAKCYADIPSGRNFYDCAKDGPRYDADSGVWIDTVYEEGLYIGYRYFDTFGVTPAYAFGHGLSYTSFELSGEFLGFDEKKGASVRVRVRNIGGCSGKQVVQLYVSKPESVLEQCARELAAFEKTALLATGGEEVLTMEIPIEHLRSYDEDRAAYILSPGEYTLWLGTASDALERLCGFTVDNERILKQVRNRVCPVEPVRELSRRDPQGTWPEGRRSGVKDVDGICPTRVPEPYAPAHIEPPQKKPSFSDVVKDPRLAFSYAAGLSTRELCRFTVCSKDDWNMAGFGMGGRLAVPEGSDVPPFAVADGNSCVKVDPGTTGFPASGVYCASFNRALIWEIGGVLGMEALERGVDLITGPGLNLHRNPLNGRNIEYFSEDPYLAGVMAGELAAGIEATGVGACYKHFIANNCEASRKRNQSIMSERTLRELYLQAFAYAMEICTPVSVMTAYNGVNGLHTAVDPELIEGLLRDELGFKGYVMTDWNTYDSCDMVDILLAGNNWLTPGSSDEKFTGPLEKAVESGRLPLDVLRESVGRLLWTVAELHRRRERTVS